MEPGLGTGLAQPWLLVPFPAPHSRLGDPEPLIVVTGSEIRAGPSLVARALPLSLLFLSFLWGEQEDPGHEARLG